MNRRLTIIPVSVLFVVMSFGCGGGEPPRGPSMAKPGSTKAPAAAPTTPAVEKTEEPPTVSLPANYAYDPSGRRDPFRSILVTSETAKSLKSLPPLLRAEIGELQLIGIVWGGFGYSAMVQTPDGKGYTIRVGTSVGPNNGVVRRITARYLTIEEKYTDIFGEKKVREVKLDLHPQKEGSE
jgi:type IV pilus assembly protein PilP